MKCGIFFALCSASVFVGWHVWICVKPYDDDAAIARLERWGMGVSRWAVDSPLLPYVRQANAQGLAVSGHIDEEKMDVIVSLRECFDVRFERCTFENRGLLARVAEMPSLEALSLTHGTVTDEDACVLLAQLAERQSHVQYLLFQDNPITDQCIEGIAKLPHLRAINLSETRISHEGLQRLRVLRPNLGIYEPRSAVVQTPS
jgi:hypothetical protein